MMIKEIFDAYGSLVLVALFIFLFILETKLPLRRRVQKRLKRIVINFIVSLPAFVLLRMMFIPAGIWIASETQELQFGLNYLYDAPILLKGVVAFLLLDYSNYIWHILLHKIPLMWRFHLVHHTDLDLDVTTAARFHFGEMFGSLLFRGAAIALIGVSPLVVLIYEIVFEAATQFHHSNMRLPKRFEKWINLLIVTPRMHGIHHSIFQKETDSNFSIIFSLWDKLHGTSRLNISQEEIIIGVPAYQDERELTIGYLLGLPFGRIREWPEGFKDRAP